jgi:hypothetical protein
VRIQRGEDGPEGPLKGEHEVHEGNTRGHANRCDSAILRDLGFIFVAFMFALLRRLVIDVVVSVSLSFRGADCQIQCW